MKELLFVYGTLKKPDVQKEVFGRVAPGTPDILEGYKKSRIKINNKIYPVVIQSSNSFVKGLVISVTPAELKLIDEYETDAYKRKKVFLKSGKVAWVYQK
jgi:gamma-glutamylcyclotransferase (GGCT)/AIG2-like uncharacterized protein YtfP